MAFVNPLDETPAPQGQQAAQQAPIAAGGQGVGGASKAAATPGVNVPAQPSAQLSAYLSANQPQAAAFGQNVAGQVSNQINAAGQSIQPAVNNYTSNLYSVPTDAAVNSAVASSPSSLTPEQRTTYQNELGAAAKAPNSASTFETTQGYQDAAGKIQGAVEQANLWNSGNNPSNIATALAPYEGSNATQGVKTLDSLLLSQTPDAYKQIQAAVAPAAGFQDQLATGTKSANDALQAAIAQDLATTPAAQASAQQYVGGLNSTLAGYLSQAQNDANSYNTQVNSLSAQEAGLQPDIAALQNAIASYNSLLGETSGPASLLTPINFTSPADLPPMAAAPSLAQLATSGQYSDLAALQSLLGPGAFSALNPSVTPETANQAGTYTPGTPLGQFSINSLLDPIYGSVEKGLLANAAPFSQYGDILVPTGQGSIGGGTSPSPTDAFPLANPAQTGADIGGALFGNSPGISSQYSNLTSYYSAVQAALDALSKQAYGSSIQNQPPATPSAPTYGTPAGATTTPGTYRPI